MGVHSYLGSTCSALSRTSQAFAVADSPSAETIGQMPILASDALPSLPRQAPMLARGMDKKWQAANAGPCPSFLKGFAATQ